MFGAQARISIAPASRGITSWRLVAVAGALALFTSCATWRVPPAPIVEPEAGQLKRAHSRPLVLGLVLSGGSARGFAHIGVIRVLEEAGIRADVVVGSSAGSIVGALYASGVPVADMERLASEIQGVALEDLGFFRLGFLSGERLRSYVNRHARRSLIEQFPIPFAAVATDFESGALVAFTHGEVGKAVQASSSIPGVFDAVRIRNRPYADGGLVSPLPIKTAREMGATHVIAVDVIYPPEQSHLMTPMSALFQAYLIQTHRLKELEQAAADVIIKPAIPPTSRQYGVAQREVLIAAGERAARQSLTQIEALLLGDRNRINTELKQRE